MKTNRFAFGPRLRRLASAARLILALATGGATALRSQTAEVGSISGVVSNQYTREMLAGAEIVLKGSATSRSTITETGGVFSFTQLPAGTYIVTFGYPGLDSMVRSIVVSGGCETRESVALGSDVYKMQAFAVAGEREGNARALVRQCEADNLKNVVASDSFGPLVDSNIGVLLQRLPGVVTQLVGGDIRTVYIRGVDPALDSVTLNGAAMPNPGGGRSRRPSLRF